MVVLPTRAVDRIALLTGGDDRPCALGMASALAAQIIAVDFIGSDKLAMTAITSRRFGSGAWHILGRNLTWDGKALAVTKVLR
jgi:hypothetical protein